MSSRIIRFFIIYASYVALFIVGKPVFMLFNSDIYAGAGMAEAMSVIGHGMSMDLSMGAYLTAIPALLLICGVWTRKKWPEVSISVWRYFSIFIAVSAIILDTVLYGYWNFKLDTTPLFYFMTSPASAMASVSAWIPVAGVLLTGVLTWGLGLLFGKLWNLPAAKPVEGKRNRAKATAVLTVLTAALFIPIRGGFTVSTMNPSAAYFSTDAKMNHAAVNSLFSFMYSATHSGDFGKEFRYFTDEEKRGVIDFLETPADTSDSTVVALLREKRPDIYIVILESFSNHLMPYLGGEPVAMRLDSIAREGVTFSNFYASSFRTDRAIPAILSGFPAQPSTSVMKFVDKAERLPSIARTLRDSAGYRTEYYYGGDINFVNQKAYLVSGGFEKIVSDKDFPISERLSKWGAHDDAVWQRAITDIKESDSGVPYFRVVQTSSSHEPFEVPYSNPAFSDKRAQAFAYADSCLGTFVDAMKESGRWDKSLIVIVPDHWGAYPQGLTDPVERHRIPLVLTGGAVSPDMPKLLDMPGAQSDIAATLLGALGIASDEFTMSHDMLDPSRRQFAFFSEPDFAAFVTPSDTTVVSTRDNSIIYGSDSAAVYPKAFLQNLYDHLAK